MTKIDDEKTAVLSDRLYHSLKSRVPIDPVSKTNPEIDINAAYAIQLRNVEKELAAGAHISGKKIGLTSEAMQTLMGVAEPDYGHLLDTMAVQGGVIQANTMLQPRVEAEIAFVLKDDLTGPGITREDVIAATDHVVAALEIVDSRVRDWKITIIDTVADNASSGRYVLGDKPCAPQDIDLIVENMTLSKNGEVVNSGSGSAVLGDPAYCVAWLANRMSDFGVTLNKGEVVLSGALSAALDALKGDVFRAEFSTLGSVSVEFV